MAGMYFPPRRIRPLGNGTSRQATAYGRPGVSGGVLGTNQSGAQTAQGIPSFRGILGGGLVGMAAPANPYEYDPEEEVAGGLYSVSDPEAAAAQGLPDQGSPEAILSNRWGKFREGQEDQQAIDTGMQELQGVTGSRGFLQGQAGATAQRPYQGWDFQNQFLSMPGGEDMTRRFGSRGPLGPAVGTPYRKATDAQVMADPNSELNAGRQWAQFSWRDDGGNISATHRPGMGPLTGENGRPLAGTIVLGQPDGPGTPVRPLTPDEIVKLKGYRVRRSVNPDMYDQMYAQEQRAEAYRERGSQRLGPWFGMTDAERRNAKNATSFANRAVRSGLISPAQRDAFVADYMNVEGGLRGGQGGFTGEVQQPEAQAGEAAATPEAAAQNAAPQPAAPGKQPPANVARGPLGGTAPTIAGGVPITAGPGNRVVNPNAPTHGAPQQESMIGVQPTGAVSPSTREALQPLIDAVAPPKPFFGLGPQPETESSSWAKSLFDAAGVRFKPQYLRDRTEGHGAGESSVGGPVEFAQDFGKVLSSPAVLNTFNNMTDASKAATGLALMQTLAATRVQGYDAPLFRDNPQLDKLAQDVMSKFITGKLETLSQDDIINWTTYLLSMTQQMGNRPPNADTRYPNRGATRPPLSSLTLR